MIFPRPTPEQIIDIIAEYEAVHGSHWCRTQPPQWGAEVVEPDAPDLYVSESEARDRQQAYDNWLTRDAS